MDVEFILQNDSIEFIDSNDSIEICALKWRGFGRDVTSVERD